MRTLEALEDTRAHLLQSDDVRNLLLSQIRIRLLKKYPGMADD